MATVASVITLGRYDLRDVNTTLYTDVELLAYLNRALGQLDRALLSLKSDLLHNEDTSTNLAVATNSVTIPTGAISIRSVWFTDDKKQVLPKSVNYIYYKRIQIGSTTGQPDYYALEGTSIIFERTADATYSDLAIYYDKSSTALTAIGNMPFSDRFNDSMRQMMVLCAKHRQELSPAIDAEMYNFFMDAAMGEVISRKYAPRRYKTDF